MTVLFHISDLHFGAEDRDALDAFAQAVRAERPDGVVVTGDLTMRARKREFQAAGEWLDQLGLPIALGVGNHDLPITNIVARLFYPYKQYRQLEQMVAQRLDLPDLAIISLRTTARFHWRVNWSKGHVGTRALRDALDQLSAVPEDCTVIVACHHPLVEVGTAMQGRTRGGARALAVLAKAGASAVLSGHVHDPFDVAYPCGSTIVRLIGAGTLSERVRTTAPSFNAIRVDGAGISVTVHLLA